MIKVSLVAAVLVGAFALPAVAQQAPTPVPVEEWSADRVSAMGAAIYRQDVAAWVSTDVLMAHLAGAPPPAGMIGWIVVEEGGDSQRVRYVRDDAGILKAAFDVVVRDGRAGPLEVVDVPLSELEKGQMRARQTALKNVGRLQCGQRPNMVVLDDPESDNWLVWILAATSEADIVPVGGHYRFRISADGTTMLRRDMLSNSCLDIPRGQAGPDGEPAALVVSQIVSQGPVETHVFLSLQNRMPIYVMAGGNLFEVNGNRIRKVER